MVLFKIALKGMDGRKKDTLLIFMVVVLSFAFIVSATMFYAGIAGTEEKTGFNPMADGKRHICQVTAIW